MVESTTLHVVTVFLGDGGTGGNKLGVFLDARGLSPGDRQSIAADLGYSETVFLAASGMSDGVLHIHTPAVELPLAGHPLVGTSWLLRHQGVALDTLNPPAGPIPTWANSDLTWIRAAPEKAPLFETRELATPVDVDALDGGEAGVDLHVWAWEDESAGNVRARVFPGEMGIAEDEATGAAALRLGKWLDRPLTIHPSF